MTYMIYLFHQNKFLIQELTENAELWYGYDEDIHIEGSFIVWSRADTTVSNIATAIATGNKNTRTFL